MSGKTPTKWLGYEGPIPMTREQMIDESVRGWAAGYERPWYPLDSLRARLLCLLETGIVDTQITQIQRRFQLLTQTSTQ